MRPKAAPLPPSDVLPSNRSYTRYVQLQTHRKYTRSLAVTRPNLQLHFVPDEGVLPIRYIHHDLVTVSVIPSAVPVVP